MVVVVSTQWFNESSFSIQHINSRFSRLPPFFIRFIFRKAAKNNYFLNGRAIRGGVVGKGPAIKEPRNFFFKCCCHLKIKIIFTLDNLSKYGHIMLKVVGRYFIWVVTIFPKNWAILVQKFWGRKKIVKIRFQLFYDGLNDSAIKRRTFILRLPYETFLCKIGTI